MAGMSAGQTNVETTMALLSAIVVLTAYLVDRLLLAQPRFHATPTYATESTILFSVALGRIARLVSSTSGR